ncbi:hypothetical protein [Halosolutus halophilus]|nr:hypothetical protein [Halosolutus halophilus]
MQSRTLTGVVRVQLGIGSPPGIDPPPRVVDRASTARSAIVEPIVHE